MVGVSASVNLPLHHKDHKFSSGTGSPGWSWKKGRKTVVVVVNDFPDAKQENYSFLPFFILQLIMSVLSHEDQYVLTKFIEQGGRHRALRPSEALSNSCLDAIPDTSNLYSLSEN